MLSVFIWADLGRSRESQKPNIWADLLIWADNLGRFWADIWADVWADGILIRADLSGRYLGRIYPAIYPDLSGQMKSSSTQIFG